MQHPIYQELNKGILYKNYTTHEIHDIHVKYFILEFIWTGKEKYSLKKQKELQY